MNDKAVVIRGTQSLATLLEQAKPEMMRISAKYVNIDRLIGLALEIYKRPDLAQCSPMSVLEFCKKCAEWRTDRIGAGGVWPVAFKGQLTAIPDWRFLIQKAKDAGAIKHATAEEVYEKDKFEYSRGLYPVLNHSPAIGDRGKCIGVYCVYVLPDDSRDFLFMAESEVEHIRSLAPGGNSPAWKNYRGEMRKKTAVRRTMKQFEGASIELSKILEADAQAMGYIDVTATEQRTPIQMPQEIPESTQADPAKETTSENDDKPADDDSNVDVGRLEDVIVSQSKEGAPKPWKKHGAKISGTIYGTFDVKLGEHAKTLIGEMVEYRWKPDGKYRNLVSIQPAKPDEVPQ